VRCASVELDAGVLKLTVEIFQPQAPVRRERDFDAAARGPA
jgi:hypothetical protein